MAKRKYHTLEEAARFESGPIDEKTYLEKLRLQKRGLMGDLLTGRVRHVHLRLGDDAPALERA